jgi:hypothetical protein
MKSKAKIAEVILVIVLGTIASSTYAGIWVDPTSFNVNTPEGCRITDTLTIGNDGGEVLNFMIRTRQSGTLGQKYNGKSMSGQSPMFSSIPSQHDFTTISPNASYKPGRLIVRFAQGSDGQLLTLERKNQILSSLGGANIEKEFRIVPGLSVVKLPAGVTVEEALKKFNETSGILYAEPDYEVTVYSTFPNDTRFNELWGMHNTGQSGGTIDADIDAPEAWDISTGSSDIIVAVIDTGVDYTHPDLAANMWVNTGEIPGNGQDDDGNGYIDDVYGYDFCNNDGDPWDDHYHGTHCSGTIGAVGNNSQGVVGVCWNVRIMALKFLDSSGSGWTSDAIKCVEYSRIMGANLSSNSWGGGGYSQGLKDAIDAAGAAGLLFVAAAGNDNTNNDNDPHYPSSYDCESLIAVMATDRYDSKSSFSNYGPTSVDLGAPGSSILSCEPGNQYQYLNGTSMATPHVSGACALLWSMNPAVSNLEIKNILLQTVDPTLAGLCVSQGRLNLYKAILEIKAPWITIVPEEGTVGPGGSTDVNVTFDALELAPGVYEAEIVIISNDPYSPTIIPVTMTVNPDDLQVSPTEGFESNGTRGGPFTPKCMTYTLTNNGPAPVSWTTSETENWLRVEPNEGVLNPSDSIDVDVCITSDANVLDPNIYDQLLTFENINSGSIKQRLVTLTVKPPDCFTESFDAGNNDLDFLSLTFSPDGTAAYYEACREKVEEFPTNPNEGTYLPLGDDDFAEVILSDGASILFYGIRYDRFYVGSNGYITFGQGDTEFSASLENHFNMPRISPLFTDLTPADSQSISYKQLQDRVAVTFKNVPLYGDKTAKNSFQVELFYVDGTIRITWLEIAPTVCVVGLSEGYGLPPQFLESDLSKYVPCWPLGDFNRDYYVDIFDLAIFVSHWLEEGCGIPYWCEKTDLDFSGITELSDYAIFAENWLAVEDWWMLPISHWKFDEGSGTIAYDSAGNNDGTIYGAAWTTGQIDGALDFDGVDDYVKVTDSPELDGMQQITLSAWININSWKTGEAARIISKRHHPNNSYEMAIDTSLGYPNMVVAFYCQNAVSDIHSPQNSIFLNQWYLVTGTNNGNEQKLYINGIEVASASVFTGPINDTMVDLWFGRVTDGYVSSAFNGKIDDIRIYNRALTSEEIWQLYQEGLGPKAFAPNPADGATGVDPNTVLSWSPGKGAASHDVYFGTDYNDVNDANTSSPEYKGNQDVNNWDPCGLDLDTTYYWRIDEINGPSIYKGDVWSFTTWVAPNFISWWKFDEGSGSIAYDSVGDNDGTIYGATWTTGQINGALSFDGSNDYVALSSFTVNTNNGTISLWFKTSADFSANYGSYGYLISQNSQYVGYLAVDGNGTVPYGIDGETNSQSDYFVSIHGLVPVGVWNHFVVSFYNKTAKTYLNGVLIQTLPVTNSSLTLNRIGGITSEFFNGKIDDVRIYDRGLTAEEVWQIYREGLGPKAFAPNPADGTTGVNPNTVLSWSPGAGTTSHDVYLGTSYSDVNDANTYSPEYKGNQDVNNWDPCGLDLDTTYYWRIDEVNGPSIYKGDVWSFTTWVEPNFISWWKFDEGSGTIAYDSAGGNDGTLVNSPVWATGQINGALSFDGINDYIEVNDNVTLDITDKITVCAWVKREVTGVRHDIVAKHTNTNPYNGFHLIIGPADVQFAATIGGSWQGCSGGNIDAMSWHYLAGTFNGMEARLYIDGNLIANKIVSGKISVNSNKLYVGRAEPTYGGYFFDGKIDDVRIYDKALTAEEIWQLYREGLGPKAFAPNPADGATGVDPDAVLSWSPGTGALSHDVYLGTSYSDVNDANTYSPEYKGNQDVNNWDPCGLDLDTNYYWRIDEVNGPIIYKGDVWSFTTRAEFDPNLDLASWWRFDEGSGNIAYDSAGDNDGTITGATWTTGQINGALSFDGSNDYVTIGDKSDLELQAFTLSFWAKLNNPLGSLQGGIAKGYIFGSATEFSYTLDFSGGNARAGITNTSDASFGITGQIVNSDWHMWSMTVGGGTITLYKDGSDVNSTGYTGTIDYTKSHNNFMIGARDNGSYSFNGKIDDVRFYNKALSAWEIWQLYQDGLE